MKTLPIYHQTKAIALFLAIFIGGTFSQAQDITGQWNGVLSVQGTNMRLVFHINKTGDGYTSTMDSPNQGAAGIPVATTTFDGSKLSLAAPNLGLLYEGEFKTDSIVGTFKQGALSLPLTMKRTIAEPKLLVRPQESIPPLTILQKTEKVVKAFEQGDFDAITVFFDETMKKGLSSESLRLAWIQNTMTCGKFEKADFAGKTEMRMGNFDVIEVPLFFQKENRKLRLAFNSDGEISGLFLLPAEEPKPLVRLQEPKPPYPYHSEDLTFENKTAGITLAGTLTMPASGKKFTAVILITGSGAQNRDEEIMGHKPFLVIADYLTRRGIAVLRYDDRGTALSTGKFSTATTADFATDAESAVAYLKTRKEINPRKIGLMGHSEGGIIAPMVAARSKDVAFIVMLAGTGLRGDEILLLQSELIARASALSEEKIAKSKNLNSLIYNKIANSKEAITLQEATDIMTTLRNDLDEFTPEGMTTDDFIKISVAQMTSPWMQYFLRYDPTPALEQVKCPVLAVNGSKDLQVPAKENLSAISATLKKGGNKKVTVKEYPNLNHLFQECATGLPAEYAFIEQTFSPEVLKDLGDWITKI